MSEAIDIESDNLCTTEDKFEQFQAVSMYEEDEFITLADIVSPPPPDRDISEILHEMPIEDVSSLVEETLNQVTSTTDQNVEKHVETTPKKRGRKKKSQLASSSCQVSGPGESESENKNNVTSQGLEHSFNNSIPNGGQVLPETPHNDYPSLEPKVSKRGRYIRNRNPPQPKISKKRGRPAKPKNIEIATPLINNDKNDTTNSLYNVSNIDEGIVENSEIKTSKRGRRKKKIPSELIEYSNEVVIEPETDCHLALPAEEVSLLTENVVQKQKGGRKSKKKKSNNFLDEQQKTDSQLLVPKDLTEDEIEDLPLVALSNKIAKPDNSTTSDIQLGAENELNMLNDTTQTSESNDNIDVHRNPKKRGRRKKVHSNDSIQIKSELQNENNITTTNSIDKEHQYPLGDPGLDDIKECISEPEANKNNSENIENDNFNDDTTIQEPQGSPTNNSPVKRNSKKPIMSDFEYNIDSIVKNENQDVEQLSDNSESETRDSSKRPMRRKVKKNLHYDEGSDEDPYANIELSDDEPRRRKGGRYNSDDEYIPGGKRQLSDVSDSDMDIDIDEEMEDMDDLVGVSAKQKRRRNRKSETGSVKSPRKRTKKGDTNKNNLDIVTQKPSTVDDSGDFEDLLETSIIKTGENTPKSWGTTQEFKDFLYKISQGSDIKIKKAKSIDNTKSPLQIPVIDQNEAKKTAEMCAQTDIIKTKAVSVQTTSIYEVPMKNQVALTTDISEKACAFLSGIVKTTAELGQLMTQKSEDFIEKKINSTYVTDTFKMDYCVKKSFLLFRLAKHNLVQMEEDLAKQYEEFLKENNLIQHREEQKVIESTSKAANSDSDCEIVEEPVITKKEDKAGLNPKTVFLNKELSIKIAKKPAEEPKPKEDPKIKARHTVWINDSIMVKKVKPTQSFLAQDSRNKKPPDAYVTLKMINDFFMMYNRQKAISTCAQFVTPEWLTIKQNYTCYYYFDNTCESSESSVPNNEELITEATVTENNLQNLNDFKPLTKGPNSLSLLCTEVIQRLMCVEDLEQNNNLCCSTENIELKLNSCTLLNVCKDDSHIQDSIKNGICVLNNQESVKVVCLKSLCYKKVMELIHISEFSDKNFVLSNNTKTNERIYETHEDSCEVTFDCKSVETVKSLLSLSLNIVSSSYSKTNKSEYNENSCEVNYDNTSVETVKPLLSLCLKSIQEYLKVHETPKLDIDNKISFEPHSLKTIVFQEVINIFAKGMCKNYEDDTNSETRICVDFMPTILKQNNQQFFDRFEPSSPISLKSLCFNVMNKTFNEHYEHDEETNIKSGINSLNFTINNVNTVSEDVFLNGTSENLNEDHPLESTYLDDEEHNYSDDCETSYDNHVEEEDNNWVSQVQMKELRSFVEPTNSNVNEELPESSDLPPNGIVNIKIEPVELLENIVESNVKTEPLDDEDTAFMPIVTVTKQENSDATTSSKEPIERQNSNSYDENAFEAFVSTNKMIMSLDSYETTNEEVFTQSTSRVRRQYEPDSDGEIENFADSLNLLVPQNVEIAKDRLMESSSDEDTNKKKKPEKRGRGRPKRNTKPTNVPPVKENVTTRSDLAILTRKMKEKIRQVEKQNESSESELEETLSVIKEKVKEKPPKKSASANKIPENEIQCNDVDSTEQINENNVQKQNENEPNEEKETVNKGSEKGAVGCEEETITHNDEDKQLTDIDDRSNSPLINTDEPVELLECEPNIAMFENLMGKPQSKRKSKLKTDVTKTAPDAVKEVDSPPYIDRHGWNCYPIDTKDGKIYQYAQIKLEKLPESFVETYLKYQDLSEQSKDDSEVDKLTNLQSLHRIQSKEKVRLKVKDSKNTPTEPGKAKSPTREPGIELQTDIKVEQLDELTPSEDEGENVEDIPPPVTTQQSADNCLAKDLLMNDDDSDTEKPDGEGKKPRKSDDSYDISLKKRLSKTKVEEVKPKNDNLMLTADKMMTKELAMLHAPVDLDLKPEVLDIKDVTTKPASKSTHKISPKTHTSREHKDKDDDSSSEEEKQWFTTKEKLLKRLEKKQECPSVDDAKRAKIVSEFIEKRSDGPTIRLRGRPPRRRSLKKLMERRKQMKILTRELLGDDASHTGKKSYQTYGKGRRNIRAVINKKALSHSTVMANMEEFERKQRLNMRQTQLREILGCEEGVNVVVINDELCLEYDFDELRPVVTVHPFFTKVMKAHQYEGVKFMWDACFESVAQVQSGHAGGGCILAHCMGLGKTLQVLALLHTVLTHPQVGMQRVLVCCPLSTVLNWVDEIHKWIGPVTGQIKVFELSKLKKTYERAYQLEDWYSGGGIFIIGYELFRSLSTIDPVLDCVRATIVNKIRTALLDPGPDIIICDEGHLLKNDCSVLAVAMSRVKTRRRIVLTGTPMQNNLREYYCMVNFVKPNLLGSYSEYSNRFENPIMNGQHRDSIEEDIKLMKARTHILHKVLEGCLQRQEASVLYPYLPKKYEYTVFVSLTKSQRELYMHYLTNYAKETKQSVLKDFHVLQKIWTHPQVLHNFFMKTRDEEKEQKIKGEKEDDLVAEDLGASEDSKPSTMETWWLPYVAESEVLDALHSSNKFLVIFRLLDECIALGDKVLIFSTSLYTMDALEYFLRRINNWSLGREYYRLDGSVPAEVRQKWCREFNAESNTGTKLFLISTRAGCLGLNMTAANRVIILDTSWNPAHDIQSIFRVYRFGQKKDCFIYRLVAMGTMEQKIYERSVTKQAVACRVVDEQQIDRHYNMSELTELYRLDEDGSGVSAGLAAGVRDAALLRVASSDTPAGPLLYAVHEHDSLLRGSSETGLAEDERAAVWSQFQEEHATKHIQNIAMNLPLNITAKVTPKLEKDQQGANDQVAPGTSDNKPKKRGRKPAVTNKTTPQPSTSSQEEPYPNPDTEETMIKKIMEILIQHNFHTTNGPLEISELIKNVRKAVANPKRTRLKNLDPVTASIAKVLIEEGNSNHLPSNITYTNHRQDTVQDAVETIVGTPADYNSIYTPDQNIERQDMEMDYSGRKRRRPGQETNLNEEQPVFGQKDSTETIVGTPVNNSIYFDDTVDSQDSQELDDAAYPERKKRRHRRLSDEEYVPDKQKMKNLTIANIPTTRKSNEYNLTLDSSINETITSDLHPMTTDKEVSEVTETASNNAKKEKRKIKKTSKKQIEKEVLPEIKKETERNKQIVEKLIEKESVNVDKALVNVDKAPINVEKKLLIANESILLSDDDEPVEVPAKIPDTIPQANIKREKQQNNKQNDEPPIPLHKSLLTNKNFIKIVAHTYLSGNPMLDEDAAILAAQYSTLKALKELEETNKDIVSGPIYDIAVQVLGRELLKKLHNASANKKDDETSPVSADARGEAANKPSEADKPPEISEPVPQNEGKKKPGPKTKTMDLKKGKEDQQKANRKGSFVGSFEEDKVKANSITVIDDDFEGPSTSSSVPVVNRRPGPKSVTTQEVVPVELFQGPSPAALRSRFPSQDECILPDDDDVIIGHSETIASPSQPTLSKRNAQPLVVNAVSSEPEKVTAVQPKVVQIVQKQPVVNPIPLPPPPTILNDPNPQIHPVGTPFRSTTATICLDSDEEEPPPVRQFKTVRKAVKSTTKLPDCAPTVISTDTSRVSHLATPVTTQSRLNAILEKKKKVILVPAADYARNNFAASQSYILPSQNKPSRVDISLDTDTPEEITSDIVSSPAVQQTRSKCMPGDIIRINKAGKIEILRKTEKPPASVLGNFASKSCASVVSDEYARISEDKAGAGVRVGEAPINKAPALGNTKTLTTSTPKAKLNQGDRIYTSNLTESNGGARKSNNSDNLRSKSPDPLSVLRNVVHIPADNYQGMKRVETQSRPNPPSSYSNKSVERDTVKSSSDLTVKKAESILKSMERPKNYNRVYKDVDNKPGVNRVIDLTDIFAPAKPPARPTPIKKVLRNIKLSGTSKDILISKAGNLVSNVKNKTPPDPPTKMIPNTKKPVATTSQKPAATEVSKRASPWQDTLPYKKKKPDGNKLTLADFNIDDLDDIIELE